MGGHDVSPFVRMSMLAVARAQALNQPCGRFIDDVGGRGTSSVASGSGVVGRGADRAGLPLAWWRGVEDAAAVRCPARLDDVRCDKSSVRPVVMAGGTRCAAELFDLRVDGAVAG